MHKNLVAGIADQKHPQRPGACREGCMWSRNLQHVSRTCGAKLMLILRDDLWLRKLMSTSPLDLFFTSTLSFPKYRHMHVSRPLHSAGNSFSKRLCPVALRLVAQRGCEQRRHNRSSYRSLAMHVARRFLRQPSSGINCCSERSEAARSSS